MRRQSSSAEQRPARLFHRDAHGRTCFSADEARLASERLVAIELDETFRDGKPECMTAEERFTLNTLDTSDGLLKTVLKNVESKA